MFSIFNFVVMGKQEYQNFKHKFADLSDKVNQLQIQVSNLNGTIEYWKQKANTYLIGMNLLRKQSNKCEEELSQFQQHKDYYGYFENPPEELIKVNSSEVYSGQMHILTKKGDYVVPMKLKDYFETTTYMKDLAEKIGITKANTNFEKFKLALYYVQDNLTYMHDIDQWGYNEQFTTPWITLATGKDDCESLATTVVGLYLAGNGDPNHIFLGLGYFEAGNQKYGHGFVVFHLPQNEVDKTGYNQKYWIGEATAGSKYGPAPWSAVKQYHAVWGLSNPFGQYLFKGDEQYDFQNWQERKGQPDFQNFVW